MSETEGKIGIVYSPSFGAGWSTWGNPNQSLDQEMARAVEREVSCDELRQIASKNWPEAYQGGIEDGLSVEWVLPGTAFEVQEYDGYESVRIEKDLQWQIALPAKIGVDPQ
jgi:hypothetical protein